MVPGQARQRRQGVTRSRGIARAARSQPAGSAATGTSDQTATPAHLIALLQESTFGIIGAEARAKLVATSRVSRVAAGQVIFHKGDAPDCCYLILKGAVKVSLPSSDGQEVLLAVLGKGDVVGEMALLDRMPRSATVTALKSCELCELGPATLERLARQDVAIFRQLLCVLSARVGAGNEMSHLQQMPLKVRLARTLLRLAQGFGTRLPDGRIVIRQKLSQAELGCMVGAARENINRQLAGWCKERVLSRVSAYYCIECRQTLERLATPGAAP